MDHDWDTLAEMCPWRPGSGCGADLGRGTGHAGGDAQPHTDAQACGCAELEPWARVPPSGAITPKPFQLIPRGVSLHGHRLDYVPRDNSVVNRNLRTPGGAHFVAAVKYQDSGDGSASGQRGRPARVVAQEARKPVAVSVKSF